MSWLKARGCTFSLIECRSLSFGHVVPLGTVSFSWKRGVLAVLGRNGAGKTTVLRTLAGLLPPLGGELEICGVRYPHLHPRELRGRREFLFPQSPPPFPVRFSDIGVSERYMKAFQLESFRDRWVNELSSGEFQRTMLARAFSSPAPLLLLDEPEVHLDYAYRRLLWEVIESEKGRRCFVIATGFVETALRLGDGFLFCEGSNWKFSREPPALEKVYSFRIRTERRDGVWYVGY